MAISGIGSFAPTMQEFITHWGSINATLGATPLTLRGIYTLTNFTTDRTNIINAINNTIALSNAEQTASAALFNAKTAIYARGQQFRNWVNGYLPGSPYVNALSTMPAFDSAESKFIDPFQDFLNLWTTINGDATVTGVPLPIALAGGYVIAAYTTDLTSLRALFVSAKNAGEQATLARRQRDVLLRPAEQRIKQYRDVIQARYVATDAFVLSLPSLSPPPGSTPDAVQTTGAWDTVGKFVRLSWSASDNAKLLQYEVRGCIGATYKTSNEFPVAAVLAGTLFWEGTEGVKSAGDKCVYRVYVVVNTGNERGSNNVAIARP